MPSQKNLVTSPVIRRTKTIWTLKKFPILQCIKESTFSSKAFTLTQSTQSCSLVLKIVKNDLRTITSYELSITLDECDENYMNLIITSSVSLDGEKNKVTVDAEKTKRSVVLLKITAEAMEPYLAENDNLEIVCEIEDVREVQSEKLETPVLKRLSMVKNFDKFYIAEEFCDVEFLLKSNVDEGSVGILKAHKLVLSGVSKFFEGMFSNKEDNIMEGTTQVVDWGEDPPKSNITLEIFDAFLNYIYGVRTVEEMRDLAFDLMVLGDCFAVEELVNACELMVLDDIKEDNIGKILLFSKKHNCKVLLERAIVFARSCLKALVETKEFPELAKDRVLMGELMV